VGVNGLAQRVLLRGSVRVGGAPCCVPLLYCVWRQCSLMLRVDALVLALKELVQLGNQFVEGGGIFLFLNARAEIHHQFAFFG
jgi:hypothetical protein